MASIPVTDLTESAVNGSGIFDELMKTTKAHLEQEYTKGRLKGPDYASVYLGSLQSVMQTSLSFLLERERAYQQAELIKAQITTEQNQHLLQVQQLENAKDEGALLKRQATRLDKEIELLGQQHLNAISENKAIEANVLATKAGTDQTLAQTLMVKEQTKNVVLEGGILTRNQTKLDAETLQVKANTKLTAAQTKNAGREFEVMGKQMCKLDAEFEVLVENKTKLIAEAAVLNQKQVTERAQTQSTSVAVDSVIGRQKGLYLAQAEGLKRDAEQKAAKLLVDSWSVRRTTDNATQANTANSLSDAHVGRVVNNLLKGVNA